ncbi:MAG: AsmA-like C-terminal region-containing protein [Myxococcota bacterium]
MRRSWLRLFLAGVLLLGAVVAYWIGSGSAARMLHDQLERSLSERLGRAVRIEAIELRLERGLRVAARNLRIQPTPAAEGEALLRAGRVVAWIDIPALLIGRLALGQVVLESPSLRIERAADGSFPALGLPAIEMEERVDREDVYGEGLVRAVEGLEPLAQRAAERMRIATRVEIRDGTVSLVDRARPDDDPPIRLELLQIEAHRNRLSEAGAFALQAVVVDGRNAPFPIRFGVRREEDQPFVWDLDWEALSLDGARRLVPALPLLSGLTGRWSAHVHAERDASGVSLLSLSSKLEEASLVLPRSRRRMDWKTLDFAARIELAREAVRVVDASLAGTRIRSDFAAIVDRPLRPASPAQLTSRLTGVEFGDIRRLVEPLEAEFETARSMARLIERVESGRILHIETSGTAPLLRWQGLWRGPDRDLPEDFLLAGAFDRVSVAGETSEGLQDLSGQVQWIGDTLSLRETRARFRGAWLPRMDISLDGISELIRGTRDARPVTAHPPAIPGLRPLARILRPRDPTALPPVKAIGLAIDRLEHPLLRWAVTDARVLVEPVRRGVQIHVREAFLGAAGLSGEIVWSSEPDDGRLTAELVATRPRERAAAPAEPAASPDTSREAAAAAAAPPPPEPTASQAVWPAERWAAGQIEMEFRPRPKLPFARATGYFRLDGSDFVARDVEISLAPQGTVETRGIVGLEDPETIGLELSFALTDGRFESHSEFFALPANLITGGMQVTGNLAGRVRPDAVFIAELDGQMRAEAKSGRIALGLPLLLRLSRATEGYNPFANEDEIGFETMRATIALNHGLLDSQDFTLEGPLRVYAKARIDTNPRPVDIRAVVGIFLFRASSEILSSLPIIRSLLPGSERGLIGAYFRVDGAIGEPDIEPLPLATFLSAVPSAIKAPMKVLQYLFNRDGGPGRGRKNDRKAMP